MRLIDADAAKLTANDYKIFRCQLGGLVDVVEFLDDMPTVDVVPLALLEKWLYEIAFNNLGTGSQKDTAFAESCEEIINRLDGLRAFIRDETNN